MEEVIFGQNGCLAIWNVTDFFIITFAGPLAQRRVRSSVNVILDNEVTS